MLCSRVSTHFTISASVLMALCTQSARCDTPPSTVTIDFESLSPAEVDAGPGKNSSATASVASDAAHGGAKAAKVVYTFNGTGYIEVRIAKPIVVSQTTGSLDVAFWVKGAGNPDFNTAAFRLMDANGNMYQYAASGLADKLNDAGWSRYQMTIDTQKPQGSWGPAPDKKITGPLRFAGFAAERAANTQASGTVYLDDMTIASTGGQSAQAIPEAKITADRQPLVIHPGESVTFSATITPETAVAPLSYRWRVRDFDGNLVSEAPMTTTAGKTSPAPFVLRPKEAGFYAIALEFLDSQGGVLSKTETSLAALTTFGAPAATAGAPLIGVNSHMSWGTPENAVKQIELMRLAGFSITRDGASWSGIEAQEGVMHWEKIDQIVDALKRANVGLLYNLMASPQWASTGDTKSKEWRDWVNAPPITEKYTNFAKAVVNRYKPFVHTYEIWNEPDLTSWLGTADQYGTLLGAAVQAIHEADPTATVMNGGISEVNYRPGFPADFLVKASTKPDVFAYHTHSTVANMPGVRQKTNSYLAAAGMKSTPVWLNEAGLTAIGAVTVREQAIVLAKKIMTSQSLGDSAYLAYDMVDDGLEPNNPEFHMGVVYPDFTPKPVFVAIHTVIDQVGGKLFSANLSTGNDATIFLYHNAAKSVAALWTDRPGVAASTLIRCDAKNATLTDLAGRVKTLASAGGYFNIPIGYEPSFFSVAGGETKIAPVKQVLSSPTATISGDLPTTYEVTVTNPLKTRLTGILDLSSDAVKSEPAKAAIDIPAEGQKNVQFKLSLKPGATSNQTLRLRLTPTSGLPQIVQEASLRKALSVSSLPAGAQMEAIPPFVSLDPSRNAVSLFEATPIDTLKFHGPTDLSAKVWLYQVPEGIRIHTVVTDDVHVQNEMPGMYWKGDSLQISIATPAEKVHNWTVALTSSGPKIEHLPSAPAEAAFQKVEITRTGTETIYVVTLLRSNPEIAAAIQYGCRISLLINDNDGGGRKGWLEWTPGIGRGVDPTFYVPIAFRNP